MTPALPPGFELDDAPALPAGFVLDGAPAKPEPRKTLPVQQFMGNIGAAGIRGAGSIGATLLTPWDMLRGNTQSISNPERRQAMDDGLRNLGFQPEAPEFQAVKLGTEVAGTMGTGGTIANVLSRIPGAARAAPVLESIRTAGMSTGLPAATTRLGQAAQMAPRMVGGGVTGAASAGLVNPGDAAAGGTIGAFLPPALKAAGAAGQGIGNVIRGPIQSPELAAAVAKARGAGYVIPPTQAKPSLANRILEGFSGKLTTAQNASAQNQGVTNRLAAESLGLPGDTKLTPDLLVTLRQGAGQSYQAIGSTGAITPGAAYTQALDGIAAPYLRAAQGFPGARPSPVIELVDSLRSPTFDAASAVEKIKQLRTAADDAFRKGDTDIARASKSAAKAMEDAIESHLTTINQPQLLQQFREARQLIAKSYTVEKALNPVSGGVDARKFAADLKRGKPLTGELRQAGEFAAQFPKAAQTIEGMGSLPQTSPLDWVPAGALSMATSNPLMMLGVAARPMARAGILSPMVQNRLVQGPPSQMANALLNPAIQQAVLRAAPLSLSDR